MLYQNVLASPHNSGLASACVITLPLFCLSPQDASIAHSESAFPLCCSCPVDLHLLTEHAGPDLADRQTLAKLLACLSSVSWMSAVLQYN